jgi:glyoxylase-like metal-dependent hydrolase (beta-lactamase superfamily II)
VRVIPLGKKSQTYTCVSYLILGDWNRLEDINTLVDAGTDDSVIEEIEAVYTGVGKIPVEQVVLTHGHFDHAGGILAIKKRYGTRILAFAETEGVDDLVTDGQKLILGDAPFEIIHTPGHSNDSICLYCEREKVLFSGDTSLRVMSSDGSYSEEYVRAVETLARKEIQTIYPGHDVPIRERTGKLIEMTLKNIKDSRFFRA